MVKLKLPSLGKGSKRRKVILVSATVSVAAVAVIVILYYTNPGFKRKLEELLRIGAAGGELGPIVTEADTVDFDLVQARVPPDTEFTIEGEFTDAEGKPVRVKQAFFYVIQNATGAAGPRRMLLQGSIGNNVGKFTKTVPTTGFPRGDDYDIIVSDHQLTQDEIAGMPVSGAALGIGEAISVGTGQLQETQLQAQRQIDQIGSIGGIS